MYKKGFTLIELLLVVAIIGILSSVILSSLSTARSKGNDAKVRSQLINLRSAMEIYYNTAGAGAYGAAAATTNGCSAAGADPAAAPWNNASVTQLADADFYPTGTTLACYSNGNTWAASAKLNASGAFWCVDSSGASRPEGAALAAGAAATTAMSCP